MFPCALLHSQLWDWRTRVPEGPMPNREWVSGLWGYRGAVISRLIIRPSTTREIIRIIRTPRNIREPKTAAGSLSYGSIDPDIKALRLV